MGEVSGFGGRGQRHASGLTVPEGRRARPEIKRGLPDPDLRPELTALIGVPQGFGLGSCCQLVPFHFSMKEMCLVYWSPSPIAQA